jgi:hypothetical protein
MIRLVSENVALLIEVLTKTLSDGRMNGALGSLLRYRKNRWKFVKSLKSDLTTLLLAEGIQANHRSGDLDIIDLDGNLAKSTAARDTEKNDVSIAIMLVSDGIDSARSLMVEEVGNSVVRKGEVFVRHYRLLYVRFIGWQPLHNGA